MGAQPDRIFVVYSDTELAQAIREALVERGHDNVRCCSGAEEVLDLVERGGARLVISQVQLDGLNGFQLCRLLSSPAYRELGNIPIVLTSASCRDSRASVLASQAGVAAFVENPVDPGELADLAGEILSGAHAESSRPMPESRSRALVVTGEDALRARATACLSGEGYQVAAAGSPREAKRVLRHNDFDLLLVSAVTDAVGDASLVEWIRRHDVELPIVVMQTTPSDDGWQRLMRSGADDYLEHPFTADDVKGAFRRAMLCRELKNTTDRIESSERRLRVSENRRRRQGGLLRSLMETTSDGIVLCDEDLKVTTLNPAAIEIFATTRAEVVERPIGELIGLASVSRLDDFMTRPRGTTGESFVVERVIADDARTLSVGLNRRDESEGGPGLLLIVRDLTDERKLQSKLAHSQKLDSLGALASGMAHDFNNILATILPNAEMISAVCGDNERIEKKARVIQSAARRGGELTRRLLAFARPRTVSSAISDPNACVESAVAMLRETLDRKIWLDVQLCEGPVEATIEASQLEHTLINLGINARDAMPNGGTLTFKTWVESMPSATGGSDGADELIGISVTDSGCGMSPETRDRIFDPFFTTKGDAGTGLGLSIASEIVKASRGFIEVDTGADRGTEFRVYLPSVKRASITEVTSSPVVRGHNEHILIVDDEQPVRELVAEMLRRLNYDVSAVAAGVDAVERCRVGEALDLVVLDMIMPQMDGRETYEALKLLKPELSIMIASGDPHNPRTVDLSRRGVIVLEKPFSLSDLSIAVRSALEDPNAPMTVGQSA